MINTSLLHFLFAGFSNKAPLQALKPNVRLFIEDDLRTELESYGAKVLNPNIAQLTSSQLSLNFLNFIKATNP